MRRTTAVGRTALALTVLAAAASSAACSTGSSGNTVNVVVGYQSKTIDTINAGTLLRSLGYFQQQLDALGKSTGKKYTISWQDYATGAPITTQMVAGKIDIGSMGDYPLLINGSTAQRQASTDTEMIAATGFNLRGALNQVVVPENSPATSLRDLAGKAVSTSVGSAADGTLVRALQNDGLNPASAVHVVNQQPSVGASALQAGSVAALSQFAAWPAQLVYAGQAKVLYDGGALNVPTLHGVVVRTSYAKSQPGVVDAFLKAEIQTTRYLQQNPVKASLSVAATTGLAPEVVYLYIGEDGLVTFDPTLKPQETAAMSGDVPFLKSIGVLNSINLGSFINGSYLEKAYGTGYSTATAATANPSTASGTDTGCGLTVAAGSPTASQVWLTGEQSTHPAATPTCALRFVRQAQAQGKKIDTTYVPDAAYGTLWFADKDIWVSDPANPATSHLQPFTTQDEANAYLAAHHGSAIVSYAAALAQA
ncbi:ABC transporter substrate-binding protein [Catenulispora acidiphila]|uniref:ABC transporter substrate-binding protein n=1 Tax=Catenulispora acidiphila TaxID=304895 RepID=UPI00019E333D|nr:ABC transporter substrate-binding protein [Catenulispora acidiphila]